MMYRAHWKTRGVDSLVTPRGLRPIFAIRHDLSIGKLESTFAA